MNMTLSENDYQKIGIFVQSNLLEWIEKILPQPRMDTQLLERMVRVEEELRHLRESMIEGFRRSDEKFAQIQREIDHRFAAMLELMNKRFEEVDKRFEQVDKRFEQVDKRFEQVDKRFEQVDKRFEQVDKRFEQVDKRFEQVDKRFEQIDQRFDAMIKRMERFMIWSFGLVVSATGTIIVVLR